MTGCRSSASQLGVAVRRLEIRRNNVGAHHADSTSARMLVTNHKKETLNTMSNDATSTTTVNSKFGYLTVSNEIAEKYGWDTNQFRRQMRSFLEQRQSVRNIERFKGLSREAAFVVWIEAKMAKKEAAAQKRKAKTSTAAAEVTASEEHTAANSAPLSNDSAES